MGRRSTPRPDRFTPQERAPLHIVDGVMLTPALVLMGVEKGNSLAPKMFRIPNRPDRKDSQHNSYTIPAHIF